MLKLKDFNWNHLYGFYEIGRNQSLKNAAKELSLASSTLSEQLKKLEESLGLVLFHRGTRGLSFTRDGELVYQYAREIFEIGSRLIDRISVNEIGGYSVNVGIEKSVSYEVATEFTSQYWDLFAPYGTVNTSTQSEHDQLVENLAKGHLDWGISLKRPHHKNLSSERIGAFQVSFCCSRELFNSFVDPKDIIRNIPLAMNFWDGRLDRSLEAYFREEQMRPKEILRSDHHDYMKKLCLRGRCVMLEAENPLNDEKELVYFHIGKPFRVELFALWKKAHENMISIKKLRELISSKFSEVPDRYLDQSLQIEVSEVSPNLLK